MCRLASLRSRLAMLRRAFSLGVLLALSLALPAWAQDAPSLEALQARYDRLASLRASFTQVTASEFADDSVRVRGRVLLAGNQYRVETPSQIVVTNDTTTWIYAPADSQVVVNDADAQASTLTPQAFLTASAQKYTVTAVRSVRRRGAGHHVLALTATGTAARFQKASLWVRMSDQIVTRLRAADRNGSTLDLRLNDIAVNPSLGNAPFTFSVPSGVEVVDLRRTASQ